MKRTDASLVRKNNARRGALLLEAALAVGVAASLVGLSVSISTEQERRANSATIGLEKRLVIDAARAFVAERNSELLEDLFQSAVTSGGPGGLSFDVGDLVTAGFLDTSLVPGNSLDRFHQQQYVLLLRPVFREDLTIPAASLDELDMDPFGAGAIDPRFLDGDLSNGELGIEAVLFSRGGTPVPLGQGPRVLDATQRINAGFLSSDTISRGAGGTMNFNITGFQGFAEYAQISQGRFASPVALGSIGVIGDSGGSTIPPELREVFLRCVDVDTLTSAYTDCITAPKNEVFTDIILTPFDSNEDGTVDRFPALLGATRILCGSPEGSEADPVDPDAFLIDCETTRLNGVLDLTGSEVRFAGDTLVETRELDGTDETVVISDRLAMRGPGGDIDLATLPFSSQQVAAGTSIPVQDCPSVDVNGISLEPFASASVAVAMDPWGRAISGSFARARRNGTDWDIGIFYTVNADFCDSTFGDPIDIRSTFSNPNDPNSAGRFFDPTDRPDNGRCGDATNTAFNGFADVYELFPVGDPADPLAQANFGAAIVTLSCVPVTP